MKALLTIDLDGCKNLSITPIIPSPWCIADGCFGSFDLPERYDYIVSFEGDFERCIIRSIEHGDSWGVRIHPLGEAEL